LYVTPPKGSSTGLFCAPRVCVRRALAKKDSLWRSSVGCTTMLAAPITRARRGSELTQKTGGAAWKPANPALTAAPYSKSSQLTTTRSGCQPSRNISRLKDGFARTLMFRPSSDATFFAKPCEPITRTCLFRFVIEAHLPGPSERQGFSIFPEIAPTYCRPLTKCRESASNSVATSAYDWEER
jgi:hypothetical protein